MTETVERLPRTEMHTMKAYFLFAVFLVTSSHAVEYTYNSAGQLVAESYANGAHLLYSYDEIGNLTEREAVAPNGSPSADLSITSLLFPDPPAQGGTATLTFTITNNGPDPASAVNLAETLPASLEPLSVTASQGLASLSGQDLAANLGTIPNGGVVTVEVEVRIAAEGAINITANITSPDDGNAGNDSTTVAATAGTSIDLATTIAPGPNPSLTNVAFVPFLVTITNEGPGDATNVVHTLNLPGNLSFASSTNGGSVHNAGVVTTTIASLPAGDSVEFFLGTGSGSVPGNAALTASVAADETDLDPANNDAATDIDLVASTLVVTNTNDSGAGSLRQAILDANADPDADVIRFDIAGFAVPSLNPATPLPSITEAVVIDAFSAEAGVFEIDGTGVNNCLEVEGSNVTLRGLVMNRANSVGLAMDGGADFITGNEIFGCVFGLNADGDTDLGNGDDGANIKKSSDVTIGGPLFWQGNVFSGNDDNGLDLRFDSEFITVQGNKFGTDLAGAADLGNTDHGLIVFADDCVIGGSAPGEGNVISGNDELGVSLAGRRNRLIGNRIGTDSTGMNSIANFQGGMLADGDDNVIGGTEPGEANQISGNRIINLELRDGPRVIGNLIGPNADLTGTPAGFPFGSGVEIGDDAVLGGVFPGEGNVISANDGRANAFILGNFIGTNAEGTAALTNDGDGIFSRSQEVGTTFIGLDVLGGGNVISGNDDNGVEFDRSFSSGTSQNHHVQNNKIGTDVTGTEPIPNGQSGIELGFSTFDNVIGGTQPLSGNTIAFNADEGIILAGNDATERNSILGNSIHRNGKGGIQFQTFTFPFPNDEDDADTGPNGFQNFPVLASANTAGAVEASLNSVPDQTYRLEFFSNTVADPSGNGEGETFLGSAELTTDAGGDGVVSFSGPPLVEGRFISATATDPDGNTSEFSVVVEVVAAEEPTDDEDPVILTAPADRELPADPDNFATLPDLTGEVVATDNVGVVAITQDPVAGTRLPLGLNNVTITVADAAGNEDTATVGITVVAPPAEVTVNTLFVTRGADGDPLGDVPGEPAGTIFTRIRVPTVDGDEVGFLASIKGPDDRRATSAIIGGDPSGVLVRVGDAAPDTNGATFLRLRDPLFSDGKLTFLATLRRNTGDPITRGNSDTGIWSELNGPLALVAREGGDAAGVADGKFARFIALASAPDSVVFLGQLRFGNGVSARNHIGLWRHTDTGTELLMRRGDEVEIEPGDVRKVASIFMGPPVRFSADQARSFGAAGEFRTLVRFTDRTRAVCVFPMDGPAFVEALNRDEVLDPAGESILVPGVPASGSAGSAFKTRLVRNLPDVTPRTDLGIFLGDENGFGIVGREGSSAPDTGDALFTFLSDPILSGPDGVTFVGRVRPGTGDPRTRSNSDFGIWTSANDGTLKLLAREGDPAPGVNNGSSDGVFARFIAHQAAPLGDSLRANVFLAALRPRAGGVNRLNRIGLWAADQDGNVELLVRTGDLIQVGEAEEPIRLISVMRVTPGTRGSGRATSETGKVVCLAGLPRGKQAVIVIQMP